MEAARNLTCIYSVIEVEARCCWWHCREAIGVSVAMVTSNSEWGPNVLLLFQPEIVLVDACSWQAGLLTDTHEGVLSLARTHTHHVWQKTQVWTCVLILEHALTRVSGHSHTGNRHRQRHTQSSPGTELAMLRAAWVINGFSENVIVMERERALR